MSHEQTSPIADSLSKKRARDRRAQQNLRKKRDAHVHALQQRIADLENELQSFRQRWYGLRRENELLKSRQAAVTRLVASWGSPPLSQVGSPVTIFSNTAADASGLLALGTRDTVLESSSPQTPSPNPHDSLTLPVPSAQLSGPAPLRPQVVRDLTAPRWELTPVHAEDDVVLTDFFGMLIKSPDMVRRSAEFPRPIELLYGSKTNVLAQIVHSATRYWPCRDPERLAAGWLVYRMARWIAQPSEYHFSLLREFQHPVSEQLDGPHPHYIDYIIWPGLRANMIKHQLVYEPHDVVGLLTCCMKVRWHWNEPIVVPDDDGELVLRPEFRDQFMNLSGWGLTKEFFDRFPLLCEDLSDPSIRYEFDDFA
jgi:hypothetical protein